MILGYLIINSCFLTSFKVPECEQKITGKYIHWHTMSSLIMTYDNVDCMLEIRIVHDVTKPECVHYVSINESKFF